MNRIKLIEEIFNPAAHPTKKNATRINPVRYGSRKPKGNRRAYPEKDLVHKPLVCWFYKAYPQFAKHLTRNENERQCSRWVGHERKLMGVRAGVSDLFIAVPNKHFAGFWIELKASGKKPTEEQYQFLADKREIGYAADWYDNWEGAARDITKYLADR